MKNKKKYIHFYRDNIVGCPSIIFHRYHEKDKTFIRNIPSKPIKSIQGYDANALYLSAIMKDMPTEQPIIRKKKTTIKQNKQIYMADRRVSGWNTQRT